MQKLIRNPITHEFLAGGARWTSDPRQAQHVADCLEAAQIVKSLRLEQAELYYSFRDTYRSPRWDFSIPLETSVFGKTSGEEVIRVRSDEEPFCCTFNARPKRKKTVLRPLPNQRLFTVKSRTFATDFALLASPDRSS